MKESVKVNLIAVGICILVIVVICALSFLIPTYPAYDAAMPAVQNKVISYSDSIGKHKILDALLKESCEQWFSGNYGSQRGWFKKKLNYKDVDVRIGYKGESENYYTNGLSNCGDSIFINYIIFDDYGRQIETVAALESGNYGPVLEVLNHELIHCYVDKYYNNHEENINHCGVFAEIENDLLSKGCPLRRNYIKAAMKH